MAGFENKTIGAVRDLIINSIELKFNTAFRILPKSFIRVIADVLSGVYIILYKQIGWFFLQIFPDSAHWDDIDVLGNRLSPLKKWGELIGVGEPAAGTQWRGTIAIKVETMQGQLIAGAQLKSDITGKLYITEETVQLNQAEVIAAVSCAENGSAGSLDAGDILSFVNPLGNISKNCEVKSVEAVPRDDETESEYRARVVARFRNHPLGGSLSDYRKWAQDVEGVLNAYPYKDVATPSGVLVYVAGSMDVFPDRVPDAALLQRVGDAITYDPETGRANRKPLTAVIDPLNDGSYANIMPVQVLSFDVQVQGAAGAPVEDFAQTIKTLLQNYFYSREPYIRGLSDDNNITKTISKNNVSSVINQGAVSIKSEFGNCILRYNGQEIETFNLGDGELAKLNLLYVNGILF